jgi:hypothetical protein
MDYLHESRPVTRCRAILTGSGRTPVILVNDPRPNVEEGRTKILGFGVDDPIPTVDVPLARDEALTFDFGAPYRQTFESLSYFRNRVDYERLPVRFETYSEEDQGRIQARMAAVAEALTRP